MKKVIVFMCFLFLATAIYGQSSKPEQEPLNPEFIQYVQAYSSGILKKTTTDGYPLGYFPHTVAYQSKVPDDFAKTMSLPEKYDLREEGLVTSMKDQGDCGTC